MQKKKNQPILSKLWNYPISKQLTRDVLLIFLGICFSTILQQNPTIQRWLFAFIPPKWGATMGPIIIILGIVFLFWWLHKLDAREEKADDEVKITLLAIAKKLGVTQEDIQASKDEHKE